MTDTTTDTTAVDDTAQDRQEQILSVIRKGNEFAVGKIKAVAGAAGSVKLPAPKTGQTRFDVPKFREDALAYARKLPAPVDVVESAFGLADRLMAEQRKLAGEVKKAAAAALRQVGDKTAEVVETVAEAGEHVEGEIIEAGETEKAPKKASRKSDSK